MDIHPVRAGLKPRPVLHNFFTWGRLSPLCVSPFPGFQVRASHRFLGYAFYGYFPCHADPSGPGASFLPLPYGGLLTRRYF